MRPLETLRYYVLLKSAAYNPPAWLPAVEDLDNYTYFKWTTTLRRADT